MQSTFLLLTQWPRAQFLAVPKSYFEAAEIYWRLWLEKSGQRLENVEQAHLVLASGKLELHEQVSKIQLAINILFYFYKVIDSGTFDADLC